MAFVLVHGAGHGAWCWYKVVDRLQNAGVSSVYAIDLTSAGTDSTDPNTVKTLEEYSRPLVKLLNSIPDKVILVAHSFGGLTVSHVMELFPEKIAAAIFVAASMYPPGDKGTELRNLIFDGNKDRLANLEFFYHDGTSEPPTSATFKKDKRRDIFYHLCPSEDVVLADMLLKPLPILPPGELDVEMTPERYGQVPRFYVKTLEDVIIPAKLQDLYTEYNPPKEAFELPSDHSPFFSTPDALVQMLLKIACLV